MLDEYKEMCRRSASVVPGWEDLSKNDLCRAYVQNKDNPVLKNAYLSAILYRYWNLISKYYYQSANCASPEECYGWLVDSVCCCVDLAAWENPNSSIYNDPNGPDKVINRCMKCARLTYYQFINRKKRRDDFGILSIDELKATYGNAFKEPTDIYQENNVSDIVIDEYIKTEFNRKNYFVSFLVYCIINDNVFDLPSSSNTPGKFNPRKLSRLLRNLTDEHLQLFAIDIDKPLSDVKKAYSYVQNIAVNDMYKKVVNSIEQLKHSDLIKSLKES